MTEKTEGVLQIGQSSETDNIWAQDTERIQTKSQYRKLTTLQKTNPQ